MEIEYIDCINEWTIDSLKKCVPVEFDDVTWSKAFGFHIDNKRPFKWIVIDNQLVPYLNEKDLIDDTRSYRSKETNFAVVEIPPKELFVKFLQHNLGLIKGSPGNCRMGNCPYDFLSSESEDSSEYESEKSDPEDNNN